MNNNANLSEMDKIFIPNDLDSNVTIEDLTDYQYGVKFWRSVPENFRLVTINRFTQKVSFKDGFGLKFIPPLFVKTILVPAPQLNGVKDFEGLVFKSKDHIDMTINFSVTMNISNPVKYKQKGCTQFNDFNNLIQSLLRYYVANRGWEEIYTGRNDNLSLFDPQRDLVEFAEECGITVRAIRFTSVDIPKVLKQGFNDKAEAEQRLQAQKIELQIKEEAAQSEAKRVEIMAQAKAKEIEIVEGAKVDIDKRQFDMFVTAARQVGMTDQQVSKLMNIVQATKGNAFVSLGENNMASNIAAGMNAVNQYNTKKNENVTKVNNMSKSDQLIDSAKNFFAMNLISDQRFKAIVDGVKRSKQYIDNCTDSQFKMLEEGFFRNIGYQSLDERNYNGPRPGRRS